MIPGSANPLLLKSAAAAAGGYQVQRSLRFNSSDSGFLSRTPAVAGNRRTWTWAGWVKRSGLGANNYLFEAGASDTASARFLVRFSSDDTLLVSRGQNADRITSQVFRDVSAWCHLVIAIDTTQGTPNDRIKIYFNGTQVTTFSSTSNPAQNDDLGINAAAVHAIGRSNIDGVYFSGYLAECYLIDGQQLTPSSFTEVSATTGQLVPKAYTGTYGTNGFWLKFSDNSNNTAATLGKDYSPNGNNWTPNNLSVTAGAGNDSLVDTPTSYGTDIGVGGEVRGNYCTWNPLDTASATLTNGNLDISTPSSGLGTTRGTFGVFSGKWYFEQTITSGATAVGVLRLGDSLSTILGGTSGGYSYYSEGPGYTKKINNNVQTDYGASFVAGDIIGVALDLDAGTLTFYKNGTSQGQAFSGLSGTFAPAVSDGTNVGNIVGSANFGQRPFAYTAPSGFKALCDTNLPAPLVALPNTVMDVVLYTGTGSSPRTLTGLGFSPDFVWIKGRSGATSHALYDAVRGVQKDLVSNSTSAETTETQGLTAFNSDGFSLGTLAKVNTSSATYAGWAWDAGTSTVSNTAGSITSQVRANVSAGFSVVTYTGNGGSNVSVGHGLGVAPVLLIVKSRSTSGDWDVTYTFGDGSYDFMSLNTTAAKLDITGRNAPTSTLFYVNGGLSNVNATTYVCYAFAPVVGYSSMGSYVGNGSADGPFVYTGFRPRWLLIKNANTGTDSWQIWDAARSDYNAAQKYLLPNTSGAEGDNSGFAIDFTSNGFKVRNNNPASNGNTNTLVYACFAESPFQYARAR